MLFGDEDQIEEPEKWMPEPHSEGWYVARCECRICTHKCIAVFPAACDPDNMECSHCGHMASEAVQYIPPSAPEDARGEKLVVYEGEEAQNEF